MSVNHIEVLRPRETVFAVLADPFTFGDWVVGASEIRDVEGPWPAPGSLFHHTQGVQKAGIKDTTEVVQATPPERLLLEVRARPVIIARVEIVLHAIGERTHVQLAERPVGGFLARLDGRPLDRLLALRNAESLRRLKRLCESRSPVAATPAAGYGPRLVPLGGRAA